MTHIVYRDTDLARSQVSPIGPEADPVLSIELGQGRWALVMSFLWSWDGVNTPAGLFNFTVPPNNYAIMAGITLNGVQGEIGMTPDMTDLQTVTGTTTADRLNRVINIHATLEVTTKGFLTFNWGVDGNGTITVRRNSLMEIINL